MNALVSHELKQMIEIITQQIKLVRSRGFVDTAFLLEIVKLDLQTKAYNISDVELRAFCVELERHTLRRTSEPAPGCAVGVAREFTPALKARANALFKATGRRNSKLRRQRAAHVRASANTP